MLDDCFKLTIDLVFPIKTEEHSNSIFHIEGINDDENLWYFYLYQHLGNRCYLKTQPQLFETIEANYNFNFDSNVF